MKRIIKAFFWLLIPLNVSGQLTPVSNQYVLNPLTINPSYAGNRGALNIAAFYRKQWIGITGAPETMTLAVDAPLLDSKLGVGLVVVNDKLGVTKETQFSSNYSYKISMGDGNLSLGLGAGIITTNTAWSDLVVLDPGDEFKLIDSRVFVVPDFSFGTYYSYHNYFIGFSIPKLLGYKFDFDKNKYTLKVNPGQYYYLFNTGYVFSLSPKLKLFPSTLVTFSPGEKLLYDVNAHFNLFDRFWVGASYRSNRSVAGLFQFAINNQLRVAYTYDYDIGKLGRYSYGSHEIMLRYEFRYKVDVVNPLIF
ncbi:MAG: type IX secretion system membrane protein PorP/SprF [Bacteroidales bacterium]|nr:type IX secretion system membrane protein PorP/SprF [Bacteroidales bacterium]